MKGSARFAVALAGLICGSSGVVAGTLGHYAAGLPNIRDFFVPPPGIYYAQYNYLYTTNTIKNRDGDTIDSLTRTGPLGTTTVNLDVDVDVFAIAPTLIWSSSHEFLGARYAAFAAPAFANNSLQASLSIARSGNFLDASISRSANSSGFGIGDPYIQPVWLGWSGKHYDISTGYGFYAPIGDDATGLDFWTQQLQLAAAWYPWEHRATAVSLAGTYEIQSNMEHQDLDPGNRFTLNWGVSQYLPLNKEQTWLAELGVSGYGQWQTGRDSGADVPQILNAQLNAKDEVYAAGIQTGLTFAPAKAALTFRYAWEFGAEARFEGANFVITFVKGF